MAYTKTTWQNNVTDIDANNLNKIEQGIYDNSLVTVAVTNKLNPTDTETYKTAELTEGQITDVIGVKDILIKGQTSQNGEPTPSAPVDVNIVSGSNIVYTSDASNKNLLKIGGTSQTINGITFTQNSNGSITVTGTATANATYTSNQLQMIQPNTRYKLSGCPNGGSTSTYRQLLRVRSDKTTNIVTISEIGDGSSGSFTTADNAKYILGEIVVYNGQTINKTFYPQLELGSTATAYTPHQGKELPLDLGSIELCKIGDYQDYFYKSGSKWYLHKETVKDVVDENNTIAIINTGTSNWYYKITPKKIAPTASQTNQICNYYPNREIFNGNTNQGILKISNGGEIRIRYGTEDTVANFKTWLASNNIILYSLLATATDTEITDTTLISQLEAIYNAPLYEQTNITQTNNDLPMILDITACKDNINGIKAFIRK